MSSKPKEAVDIVFDGKKLANWFIYDRQVLRFMRKKYGIIGEQIWLGTSIPIETATVDAIAQDVYWEIVRKENHKEASEYWGWDYFWTVSYQQKWRENVVTCMFDYPQLHFYNF